MLSEDERYAVLSGTLDYALPLIGLTGAITVMVVGGEYIMLYGFGCHAFTAATIFVAYMVAATRLRFLSVPWRELAALSLIVFGIHVYDLLWGLASLVARGGGFPYGPFSGVLIAGALLLWLDSRLYFLRFTFESSLLLALGIIVFTLMIMNGFYHGMTLYDVGVGPNPSTGTLWASGKAAILLFASTLTMIGRETRVIRWSL